MHNTGGTSDGYKQLRRFLLIPLHRRMAFFQMKISEGRKGEKGTAARSREWINPSY